MTGSITPASGINVMAQLATDAGGGLAGVVGPDGSVGIRPKTRKNIGASVCDWQATAGSISLSAGTGAACALDSTVTLYGKPAVKCTFSTAASDTFIATFTLTNPVRLRDVQTIQVPILFTSNLTSNGIAAPFQVWLQTSNSKSIRMQLYFQYYQSGVWNTWSFNRSSASVITNTMAELDAAGVTITSVKIVAITNATAANSNPIWVGEITADARAEKGRVSIVMDGEYTSQYTKIFPLLKQYGFRASLAITNSEIGLAGHMNEVQLGEMNDAGNELIHHTFNASKAGGYGNATDWPAAADISEDMRAQWAYFAAKGWTRGIGYCVWGFTYGFNGTYTQARQDLVAAGLKNGGAIAVRKSGPYNSEASAGAMLVPMVKAPVNPLVVDGAIQITSTHTAQDIKNIIDTAERTGQWAIITVHRAVDASPGSLEMLTSDFAGWMAYLAQRSVAGGVIVEPFGEAYNAIYN